MFYAYVLKSINHDFLYKGHCENVEERLIQHNSGMTQSDHTYHLNYFIQKSLEQGMRQSLERSILKLLREEDF